MGLESLQSIFNENLDSRISDFSSGRPAHSNDSRIAEGKGAHIQNPILSTILIPKSSFVDESTLAPNYDSKNYDPRLARPGTVIINKNVTKGTVFDLPLSKTEAEIGFSLTNNRLKTSGGWESLYTSVHTAKPLPSTVDLTNPFQPLDYGPNVSRDNLHIRYSTNGSGFSFPTLSDFSRGQEPYIVSPIATSATDIDSGRTLNFGSRMFPQVRGTVDQFRIASYLGSPSGRINTLLKNVPSTIPTAVTIKKRSADSIRRNNLLRGNEELDRIIQRYNTGFSRTNLLFNVGRDVGMHINSAPFQSGGFLGLFNQYSSQDSFGKLRGDSTSANSPIFHSINGTENPEDAGVLGAIGSAIGFTGFGGPPKKVVTGGDVWTTSNLESYDENFVAKGDNDSISTTNDSKNGMPFYFVDLRDNTVTNFRAYLDGINENISPNWTSTNYIGRSEAVYVYGNATREISFNLKLYAHTRLELQKIYVKVNRLTSMCYPQYQEDELFNTRAKQRMKPPLTKLRLGDLYGAQNRKELTGFIKSLTYTVPDESPWEMNNQEKVPKYLQVAISYQVIHSTVPDLNTFVGTTDASDIGFNVTENSFYGITDNQPLESRD